MSRKIEIPYHLVASGGEEKTIPIYTNPGPEKLRVRRVIIYFPIGNYFELKVALYRGVTKVYPSVGELSGDNIVFDDEVDLTYFGGEEIRLYYRNENATETRECFIYLIGYLE